MYHTHTHTQTSTHGFVRMSIYYCIHTYTLIYVRVCIFLIIVLCKSFSHHLTTIFNHYYNLSVVRCVVYIWIYAGICLCVVHISFRCFHVCPICLDAVLDKTIRVVVLVLRKGWATFRQRRRYPFQGWDRIRISSCLSDFPKPKVRCTGVGNRFLRVVQLNDKSLPCYCEWNVLNSPREVRLALLATYWRVVGDSCLYTQLRDIVVSLPFKRWNITLLAHVRSWRLTDFLQHQIPDDRLAAAGRQPVEAQAEHTAAAEST